MEETSAEFIQRKNEAIARLRNDIETGRLDEIGDFLLEHLAEWGPFGIDSRALARRIQDRNNEEG